MHNCINIIEKRLSNLRYISAEDLAKEILKLRYLSDEFTYYPEYIIDEMSIDDINPSLVYYPFDIIELRKLLGFGAKSIKKKNVYFSFNFSKKHFLDYPILIGFKTDYERAGSLFFSKEEKVELGRIYIREDFINDDIRNTISNIVNEECLSIDISELSEIPVLKVRSNTVFNMKKYSMLNKIELTPNEKNIFDFLLKAKNSNPALVNTELRVAGGWVRDKLLGLPSDDIDITVSGMTGQQFLDLIGFSGAHIIEKNPEKSKQLETAKADILGQEVDFVNLRTEEYKPGSRIPTQTITNDPKEDAQRRDLTINALFYNIETGKIEDYVGGIEDLKTMTLKTPMNPIKTLIDDPIRSLRILRFYSRYPSSKIDDNVIEAMRNPHVQNAYDSLAPERASKELRKMFAGEKPVEAAKILLETGLYRKVFKIPDNWHPIDMDQQSPYHNFGLLPHTVAVMQNYEKIADKMGVAKDEKGLMLLSAMLHDFGKMNPDIRKGKTDKEGNPVTFDRGGEQVQQMRYIGHDKASAQFAEKIMTRMGFSPNEKKFVVTIVSNHMTPHNMTKKENKKLMGRFLNTVDDLYDKVIGHAMADALSKSLTQEEEDEIRGGYENSLQQIEQYRQEMGNKINTPLIDGNKIMQIVKEVAPELLKSKNAKIHLKRYGDKPVHFMTYLNDKMKEEQWKQVLTTPEQAEDWVKSSIKQFMGIWNKQQSEQDAAQTNNIDLNKQADASSGTSVDDYSPYEGNTPEQRSRGITYLKRTVPTRYTVGQKVRLDVTGLNSVPVEGRIISKKNNIIIVEWISGPYKGKRKAYDLTDTVSLYGLNIV